jgi:hypothetical protein
MLAAACSNSSSSPPTGGFPPVQLPGTATIVVDIGTEPPTVTVPRQPPGATLEVIAQHVDALDMVRMTVAIVNDGTEALHHVKAVFPALSDGELLDPDLEPAPLYQDEPYAWFGATALVPGGRTQRFVDVGGIDASETVLVFHLELVDHPAFIVSGFEDGRVWVGDSSGTGEGELSSPTDLFRGGDASLPGRLRESAISPDGLYALFGTESAAIMGGMHLANARVGVAYEAPVQGYTSSPVFDPDGEHFYSLVTIGVDRDYAGPVYFESEVFLVKTSFQTLSPAAFVHLPTLHPQARGRRLSITPDGTRAAVAVGEEGVVFVVDLLTMTVVDADAGTPGDQGFDVSATSARPEYAAIAPDGQAVYVAHSATIGDLDRVDLTTGAVTSLQVEDPAGIPVPPGTVAFGPDGRLYTARMGTNSPAASIWDPAAEVWTAVHPGTSASSLAFSGDGLVYYLADFGPTGGDVRALFVHSDEPMAAEADGAPVIETGMPEVPSRGSLLLTPL